MSCYNYFFKYHFPGDPPVGRVMVRVHSGKEGKSGVTVTMSLFFYLFSVGFPVVNFSDIF